MNNTKMKDLILKGKWFKTDDIRTLIARVQDFFNIDLGYLVDKLLELERLAEIGKAILIGKAYIGLREAK